jgi:site-specific recombinase XerD
LNGQSEGVELMTNQLINDFLDDCRASGKSKGTVEQYALAVKEFIEFIEKKYFKFIVGNLNKIELTHLKSYLVYLTDEKENQAITRRKKVSALKMFFKYLKSIGKVKINSVDDLDSIKVKRKIPKYFAIDECKSILSNIKDRNQLRNETIILLFLNTGMRLSELVSLNVQDVDKNCHTITGKGDKERPIYLSQQIQEQLQKYIKERPKVETNALFISERGNRINKVTVQQMIKAVLNNAGLQGKTHTLRHTFATQLYQSGKVDLRQLQELLGHADISTTTIYTQVAKKALQQVAENNPLNILMK